MNGEKTLNILNGQAMYDFFMRHHADEDNVYAPFNEAMCVGEGYKDIFSDRFNQYRCDAFNTTIEKYTDVVLNPLQPLFNHQFTEIVLWFDDDMFCQINLLTLLAFLDQRYFNRKITFNLVNHEFKFINRFEFGVHGYHEAYQHVLIRKCLPQNIRIPVMEQGIKLYLEYIKDENEITAYIRQSKNIPANILVGQLFKIFPQYGLGDRQYFHLIEKCRINHGTG